MHSYEFHSHYPLAVQQLLTQGDAVSYLSDPERSLPASWPALEAIADPYQRVLLLAQALATRQKDRARVGDRKTQDGLLKIIKQNDLDKTFNNRVTEFLEPLNLLPSPPTNLAAFPPGTWSIKFQFTLRKPYLSQDDTTFYIIDNPIKKEWVFKLPYIAPSQWKGALRAAMVRELVNRKDQLSKEDFAQDRFRLTLLFGDEKGEGEGKLTALAKYLDNAMPEAAKPYRDIVYDYFNADPEKKLPSHAGRLHFYPTYFTQIDLEVINPHERDTGVGKNPIYIESVPRGATGTFALFYVPLDRVGKKGSDTQDDAQKHLKYVAEGIEAMMTVYGFGAKTSSGFGVAEISHDTIRLGPDTIPNPFFHSEGDD